MDDITVGQVVAFIVAVSAFWTAIRNVSKPVTDLKNKIGNLETRMMSLEISKEKDYERFKSLDKDIHLMLKVCYNLLEHEVTGNHTQNMTNTLNELRNYMLDK